MLVTGPSIKTTQTGMKQRSIATATIFVAATLVFSACKPGGSTESDRTAETAQSDAAQIKARAETIAKQLSRNGKLPSLLLDARFVEEKAGDGVLGPADFFAFYALSVSVADIPLWRAALADSPVVNGPAAYAAPKADAPWWPSRDDFSKLELFGPKSLTGRFNGWVGLAPDGRIFIYAFTM
jgi:hypothetical protein